MCVTERGSFHLNVDGSPIDFKLDFDTFLPIADELLDMSLSFITWQPYIVSIRKDDETPVSNADTNAQVFITNWLHRVAPGIPVRGEESETGTVDFSAKTYWSIDPIDGTRYYEAMKDDWCVSVALVVDGEPCAAIVLQPGRGEAFVAIHGKGIQICTRHETWRPLERKLAINPMLVVPTSLSVLRNPVYTARAVRLTTVFENTFSAPSVLAVLEIIRGHAWGWASIFEPWQWDIASTYVLIKEMGGVAICADGAPIPWDKQRVPPVVFAISPERAAALRIALNPTV